MKSFEILLNYSYTATTTGIASNLQFKNDYFTYVNQIGGGLVNAYNVRGYLNDQRNIQITTDFFSYLTGSTSTDQALNILYSDQKLASVFNDYYQRIILSGNQVSTTAVIQQNLTGTNQIIAYTFNHPWSGYAPNKQITGITQEINGSVNAIQSTPFVEDFTTEQSYYIPIYLENTSNQLSRQIYNICDTTINAKTAGFYPQYSGITSSYFGISSIANIPQDLISNLIVLSPTSITSTGGTRIHTILNCFVDINLETDENSGQSSSSLVPIFVTTI